MKTTFWLTDGRFDLCNTVCRYFGVVERPAPCKSGHYHFRLPLDVDGVWSSTTAEGPAALFSFVTVNAEVVFVVSRFSMFTNDSTFDRSFSSIFPSSSASCFFFCFSKAFIFLAASVFWWRRHSNIASLSYKKPSGVTTGSRQGWRVSEQQSKLFTESLPNRTALLPYPDFWVSFFRSW